MAKAAPARPVPTFDHLRKKAPLEQTVRIPLNEASVVAHARALDDLGRAQLALKSAEDTQKPESDPSPALVAARTEHERAEQEHKRAKAALDAETVTLRFRSIGRPRYDALVREHPPADEVGPDGTTVKSRDPYDAESFAPALIAASCVEPKMSEAQVMALWDLDKVDTDDLRQMAEELSVEVPADAERAELVEAVRAASPEWNAAELMEMWIAALAVNTQRRVADFGNFSNGTRG